MFLETKLVCPLCGNSGMFVHTFMTLPTFGECEACGYLHSGDVYPRSGMEHRRPKTIPDWQYYAPENTTLADFTDGEDLSTSGTK